MIPRVVVALALIFLAAGCSSDPRQPDYIPQATIPLHPDPPVAAGGPPRTKAPAAQPKPQESAPKPPSDEREKPSEGEKLGG
jgi:hypothetical protein